MEESIPSQDKSTTSVKTSETNESKPSQSEVQQDLTSELPLTPKKKLDYRIIAIILFVFLAGLGVILLINLRQKTVKMPQSESSDQTVLAPTSDAEKVVAEVVAAVESRDWAALYELTPSTFTADMTLEQFAAQLSAQEVEFGRVINIEILSKPDYQTGPQGIQFFTVLTKVTYDKDGTLEVEEFVDTYILEDGEWKFWFSETE